MYIFLQFRNRCFGTVGFETKNVRYMIEDNFRSFWFGLFINTAISLKLMVMTN